MMTKFGCVHVNASFRLESEKRPFGCHLKHSAAVGHSEQGASLGCPANDECRRRGFENRHAAQTFFRRSARSGVGSPVDLWSSAT